MKAFAKFLWLLFVLAYVVVGIPWFVNQGWIALLIGAVSTYVVGFISLKILEGGA